MLEFLRDLVRRLRLTDRVLLARVARWLLVAIAGLGWVTMSEDTIAAVSTAVAAVASVALTRFIGNHESDTE